MVDNKKHHLWGQVKDCLFCNYKILYKSHLFAHFNECAIKCETPGFYYEFYYLS